MKTYPKMVRKNSSSFEADKSQKKFELLRNLSQTIMVLFELKMMAVIARQSLRKRYLKCGNWPIII